MNYNKRPFKTSTKFYPEPGVLDLDLELLLPGYFDRLLEESRLLFCCSNLSSTTCNSCRTIEIRLS